MTLTRDFKQTVVERVEHDREFAKALFHEAEKLSMRGESEMAHVVLRNLGQGYVPKGATKQ